jgi:hypothetical protein
VAKRVVLAAGQPLGESLCHGAGTREPVSRGGRCGGSCAAAPSLTVRPGSFLCRLWPSSSRFPSTRRRSIQNGARTAGSGAHRRNRKRSSGPPSGTRHPFPGDLLDDPIGAHGRGCRPRRFHLCRVGVGTWAVGAATRLTISGTDTWSRPLQRGQNSRTAACMGPKPTPQRSHLNIEITTPIGFRRSAWPALGSVGS